MEKKAKYIDYFEKTSHHPSLDIRDGMLVLGFRIKPTVDKEENLYVIARGGAITTYDDPRIQIGESRITLAQKNRKLEKLSSRWSYDDLMEFIDNYSAGKVREPSAQELFQKVVELAKKYVDLETDADYTIIASWIIGTYFFPAFSAFSFLNLKSPKGSGKTQCLNFLQQVCFNPMKARASLPALREAMDSIRGTYLMDQADSLHRNNNGDLCDILTDSYKRAGGQQRKMVSDSSGKTWKSEEFETYGPKVFASINQLPVDLRDRCVIVPLIRSGKNFPSPDDNHITWREVRGELYKLLISSYGLVESTYAQKASEYRIRPVVGKIGRPLELWLPIETILHLSNVDDSTLKGVEQRFFAQYGFAEFEVSELEDSVIKIVIASFDDSEEVVLSPRDIVSQTNLDFDEFFDTKQKAAKVGRIIKKYNLASEKLKRSNKGERYLFKKEHVEKVASGYGILIEDNPSQSYTPSDESVQVLSNR